MPAIDRSIPQGHPPKRLLFVSTFPPTLCGIASFTSSLVDAILDVSDGRQPTGDQWVFGPEASYERTGDVPGVVFSCGWVEHDEVSLYYGAADTYVGLATARVDELIDSPSPTRRRSRSDS